MKKAVIVGAAPIGNEKSELIELLLDKSVYSIAADGGIQFFIDNRICPDQFVGDLDSFTNKDEILKHFPDLSMNTCSPVKDVTDLEIAVSSASVMGYKEISVFGGLGGKRLSHSMANIQLMSRFKIDNVNITLIGSNCIMYVLKGGDVATYGKDKQGFISVISLSDESKEVNIKGLFYEYSGSLYNTNALGVSNEFVGKEASISLKEGLVLIIEE